MARRQAPRRPQLAAVATVVTALLALAACGAAGEEDDVAWMLQLRRRLHEMPELSFEEEQTSALIRQTLAELGVTRVRAPVARTGIVADIGSGGAPIVVLRADIDALPVQEATGLPYASKRPGRMHACGHDGHTSMLLLAARRLKAMEAELKGTVRLLFQPAEEGLGGARVMMQEGALDGAAAVFGMHVDPSTPTGTVLVKPGPTFAASDRFTVVLRGQGGHAGMPHTTRDPVVAASMAVVALQAIVAREVDPVQGGVVSVSRFNTGEGASNIIPDAVTLSGTIRAFSHDVFAQLRERVTAVFTGTAAAHGCTADVEWSPVPYPPLVTSAETTVLALAAAAKVVGGQHARQIDSPFCYAEDFAFYCEKMPCAFAMLGIRNETAGSTFGLHTDRFRLDESALPLGAALHVQFALDFLAGGGSLPGSRDEL